MKLAKFTSMKIIELTNFKILISSAILAFLLSCGGNSSDLEKTNTEDKPVVEESDPFAGHPIGVGPITELKLEAINDEMAQTGKEKFDALCTACHKVETKHIGPPLHGVTKRRRPEWIMNMILNPEKMVMEDDTARSLLGKYIAPMANQNLTEEDARAVLEYFRQVDASLE